MANANSSAPTVRSLRSSQETTAPAERVETERRSRRLASGVYSFVAPLLRPNPYAGLDRLDRAELDETDES
jgi:hypothetical protein